VRVKTLKKIPGSFFLFWLILPVPSPAQTVYTTVQLPYPLEDLGHSPRALAMGSAFAAAEGDAACLYWNPAGLDGLAAPELSLFHESWLADISQETAVGAYPIGKAGTVALGANYLSFGQLDGYNSSGYYTASYSPFRASFALGWGGTLVHSLSIGFSVRGLFQTLVPGVSTTANSFSTGFLWRALPDLRIGGFYSFLYSDASPQLGSLDLGESWAVPLFSNKPMLLLVDFSMPPEGVYRIQAGVEQPLFSFLFGRFGFQQELRDNLIEGFRGFSGGIGIELKGFDLDYTFAPDGDLGYSQMFGLTYHLPESTPKNPPPKPSTAPGEPLNFKPPSEIKPQDRVVQVEVHFNLPDSSGSPSGGPVTPPSPGIQRAIEAAAQKVQANPQDAEAWVALGNLYWQSGQPEYTVQSFEEALRLRPDNNQLKSWIEGYKRLHPNP
jgi:hypothetical protein